MGAKESMQEYLMFNQNLGVEGRETRREERKRKRGERIKLCVNP
jgi:hypothetical protein